METIDIVIRIPKQVYEHINVWKDIVYDDYIAMITNAILNGTVLPKGHGDLVDRKQIIEHGDSKGFCDWYEELKYAPTVIEADKDGDTDDRKRL